MYDEPTVKKILQRAMELDAIKTSHLAKHDVVQIAVELGISEASVNQAIREISGPHTTIEPPPARPQLSTLRLLNLAAGVGVLFGFITNRVFAGPMAGGVIASTALLVSLLMVSGGLAASERTRSLARFFIRNSAVWLGVAFGWRIAAELMFKLGSPHMIFVIDEFRMAVARFAMIFAITTIAGAAFILLKRQASATTSSGTTTGGRLAWISGAVRRVRQWVVETWRTVSLVLRSNLTLPRRRVA